MFRLLLTLCVLALLASPVALAVAAFRPEPLLPTSAQLSPAQAALARDLLRRVRDTADGQTGTATLTVTAAEMDSLLASGARVLRPLRGRTIIDADGIAIAVSAQLPRLRQLGWVNFQLEVAPSNDGLDLRRLQIGALDLPPGPALALMRMGLDAAGSEDLGSLLLGAIKGISTAPGTATLRFDSGGVGDESLFSRTVTGLREAAGVDNRDLAGAQYAAMAAAARRGTLPSRGSVGPWLGFAAGQVAAAVEAGTDRAAAVQATLLALAAHCGDPGAIRIVAGDFTAGADPACTGTTLGGRSDLRQHFTLSAALQATGGSAASFGLGEVKEMVDAGGTGGSGFSFDDIAADRAGIRFAEALADADFGTLTEIATDERRVMPSVEGLPSGQSAAEFAATGGVDSPAYAARIAEIDARIDRLPAYTD